MKRRLSFALPFLCLISMAQAMDVAPVAVRLDVDRPNSTIRIRNDGESIAAYRITGYRWRFGMADRHDVQDTGLIITPPALLLAPQEERLVRIRVFDPQATDEIAYKLSIEELLPGDGQTASFEKLQMRLYLPVFFAPGVLDEEVPQGGLVRSGRQCQARGNAGKHFGVGRGVHLPVAGRASAISLEAHVAPDRAVHFCALPLRRDATHWNVPPGAGSIQSGFAMPPAMQVYMEAPEAGDR